jgi:malate dehydrogenase
LAPTHRLSGITATPATWSCLRKELLGINGKIFVEQGQAIAKNAAFDIRVLVVGNLLTGSKVSYP